ncbi:MAG: DUF935 family protein [Burkholderia sp.]
MEERDAHLYSEMVKRRRSVIKLNWDIQPPSNATAEEKNLAAFAHEQLLDMADFEDLLFDCFDPIGNGFAALEREWTRVGAAWLVEKHHWQPQYWFQLDHETRMQIKLRDGTPDGAALMPFGWILHQHKAGVSGYTVRQALMRVLVWPYLFKNYAVGDLAEFLDIYGLPMRVGKYPQNATPDERATLMRAMLGIGHNAAGIIPQAMAIEFEEAAKGTDAPFLAMIGYCDRAESKAIVGQTMSADAHASGLGSGNAALHGEVRQDIRDADCKLLASTITQQLIYPILALNKAFVDARYCPRIVFDNTEPEDIKIYADGLPKLVAMGMQISRAWAHEKLHIPVPAQGEDVLKIDVEDVKPLREVKSLAAATAQAPVAPVSKKLEEIDPQQMEIDRALDMLARKLPAQGRDLARAALAAVTGASDFTEALARAMFVVDVVGTEAVQRETGRDSH